jgi:hypothetical protein
MTETIVHLVRALCELVSTEADVYETLTRDDAVNTRINEFRKLEAALENFLSYID